MSANLPVNAFVEGDKLFPGSFRADRYADAYVDAVCGEGEMWGSDCESWIEILDAVKSATASATLTDEERWQAVERVIRDCAHKFALMEAEEAWR